MEPGEKTLPNDAGEIELHKRMAFGETLTEIERATLDAWYARNDAEEAAQILLAKPETLEILREQVDVAIAQLVAATQRTNTLYAETESIRREVTALSQRLARSSTKQTT